MEFFNLNQLFDILCPRSYACSSPRNEKNSNPPTGENLVPCKRIIRVNPNKGKQGGILEKESPGIANSQRISELAPNGINSEVPAGKFQRRSKLAPKEINSKTPAKAKRNPREGISGDFHSQVQSELAPKGNKFRGA